MENEEIRFGGMYMDKLIWFVGKCTAKAEYIEGDHSVRLEGLDNTGRPVDVWVDERRIVPA